MVKRLWEKASLNKYLLLFFSLLMLGIFLLVVSRLESYYGHQVYENAIDFKKTYIKETVDHLASDIDATREDTVGMYNYILYSSEEWVKTNVAQKGPSAVKQYIDEHTDQPGWAYIVYDKNSKQLLQDPLGIMDKNWNGEKEFLDSVFAASLSFDYKNTVIVYGILKTVMDNFIEDMYRDKIHRYYTEGESYIWINKILNYDGGKNYAIRLVHPNLPTTEGMFLSTDMQDAHGNYPYLDELEGIKNNEGEYFYSYYFNKKDSSEVGKKFSYAKLYPDYNWIICMGVYYDDVLADLAGLSKKTKAVHVAMPVAYLLILLILIALFLQIHADQKRFELSKDNLRHKTDLDELTHANSRKFGAEELDFAYRKYVNGIGMSPAVMLMDVDFFKEINDTYGQEEGDRILKEIVNKIYETIRNSDVLIRWGGDEFIGVFYGINRENIKVFAEKILSAVNKLSIDCKGTQVHVTVSLGFAFFMNNDISYESALRRADNALYEAKKNGRNQFCIR